VLTIHSEVFEKKIENSWKNLDVVIKVTATREFADKTQIQERFFQKMKQNKKNSVYGRFI